MLQELTTLSLFFKNPLQTYSAREIARVARINHVTVAKKLKKYPFITRKKYGPYLGYGVEQTATFLRLRFVHNYLSLHDCGLIEYLSREYDQPTIVLFGSYASATQTPASDIDILIISQIPRILDTKVYAQKLQHTIQLFVHTQKELHALKKKSPHLVNSWCNGFVIQGELELFDSYTKSH